MTIINHGNHGERAYKIALGTGTAWAEEFIAYAYNEQEALDLVADHLETEELHGLYYEYGELNAIASCSEWKTAEAFAEAHNLTCCGNHGIYVELVSIAEITNDLLDDLRLEQQEQM